MMRSCSRLLVATALLAVIASPAAATKYAGEFMKIPVGARAVGMGGAFSAVCDAATSPYWNPAGMVFLPYREGFLQHAEEFGSLNACHQFGHGSDPQKNSITLGSLRRRVTGRAGAHERSGSRIRLWARARRRRR